MRIIECRVSHEYIEGSGVVIGAAGSHNDVALRLTFDEMWMGLNIYATFTDALGEQSGVILLTPSMLVSGEAMIYDLPIPAVAKRFAGKSMLTLSGFSVVNGTEKDRATNTATAYFRVLKSDYTMLEGSKITPTIEEQIFSEINALGEKVEDTETDLVELREGIQDNADKISGLEEKVENIEETDPTVPDWAKQPRKPAYTAEEVGAAEYYWVLDTFSGIQLEVNENGRKINAVSDEANRQYVTLEILLSQLEERLNAVANSSDVDLDQLAEIVAYIKSNKTLIDAITTSKVNITDIVDNLLTNASNKPLSAKMGVELKRMIEEIQVPESNIPAWALQPNKPSYSKDEVGLGNVDNVKQYSASNPPPYPVTSVNGQGGAVSLDASDVGAMPAGTKIPTKTSDISNDSGFITKAVSDLVNYYTKSSTYNKEEVNALISAIPKFAISVVSSLPTSNISTTTVYLVGGGESGNLYTEHIYVNDKWELLGTQSVDLTGYATEAWVNVQLASYMKQSELNSAINTALETAKASGEFDGAPGKTPVKGTDYFTPADKTEMVNAVIAALPYETWTFELEDGTTVSKEVMVDA